MKVIIVGAGKLGKSLTKIFIRENYNITIIDQKYEVVKQVVNTYEVNGIIGNGANTEILQKAHIDEADLLISVTTSDEFNIMCSIVAKKLGAKNTIARVRNPEYSSQMEEILSELGISMMINPDAVAADEIYKILMFPAAVKVDTFLNEKVSISEFVVKENTKLCDIKLEDLNKLVKAKILVCAIKKKENLVIPQLDTIIEKGDRLYVLAVPSSLNKFCLKAGIYKQKTQSAIIVGGSKISYYLAKKLASAKVFCKIIEQDKGKCIELSENLEDVIIIEGNGTDQDILYEEDIKNTDALVALTGMDEENVIISMFAQSQNVDKVIAKVDHINITDMLENINIDSIIDPRNLIVNKILKYVRSIEKGESLIAMQALSQIANNEIEVAEFILNENDKITNKLISELNLKENVIITSVLRKKRVILPNEETKLLKNDTIVVAAKNMAIKDLGDIVK